MWPVVLFSLALGGTVDRIEGDLAVVEWEDGSWSDLPLPALPPGVAEGAVIELHLGVGPPRSIAQTGSASRVLPSPPPSSPPALRVVLLVAGTQPRRDVASPTQRSKP